MKIEERELTKDESRWCRRLQRVLKDKPRTLEIYVGLGSVIILGAGARNRCFDESAQMGRAGSLDSINDYALFSFRADIEGDASGL